MPDKTIIDKILNAIFKVIIPDKVILFGSQARGDARPDSDYDILVIKSGIEDESKIEGDIYVKFFYEDVPVAVDVIVAKPEDIEKYKEKIGCFLKSALKEGITIYGR
jgi:predicted nucleotidyltransferase